MSLMVNATNNTESKVWEFSLAGEIDISNADGFKTKLEDAMADTKQDITVDLSELNYIDSTGLGVIIGIYSVIKKDGYSIKVLNPRDNVRKLLAISGLDKILC